MNISSLIDSLDRHWKTFPLEQLACERIIAWIGQYGEFAFARDNLAWHLTWSMLITNPERTKVLLMLHKKFQRWQQFGGHCDGETDVFAVASREFHEESGIDIDPERVGDIFLVDVHNISVDLKGTPAHYHFDIMYLGIIDESVLFSRQESEVDDIRWFDIQGIENYLEWDMVDRIMKIRSL